MSHVSLSKFAWTCVILQIVFVILFTIFVRYGDSANAHNKENQEGKNDELKENLEKYPGQSRSYVFLVFNLEQLKNYEASINHVDDFSYSLNSRQ